MRKQYAIDPAKLGEMLGISPEEQAMLLNAAEHSYHCRCEQCRQMWKAMGPDPETDRYGPFTEAEIKAPTPEQVTNEIDKSRWPQDMAEELAKYPRFRFVVEWVNKKEWVRRRWNQRNGIPDYIIGAYPMYPPDGGNKGQSTSYWWPSEKGFDNLRKRCYDINAQWYLHKRFPDLHISLHMYNENYAPRCSVWVSRMWTQGDKTFEHDAEALGHHDVGRGLKGWLATQQERAAAAKQEGMFLCTNCEKVRPTEELEEVVFAAYFCKQCYQEDPSAKEAVDDSRRPGFYD